MGFWIFYVLAVVLGSWPITVGYVGLTRNVFHVPFPECFYVDAFPVFMTATGILWALCARAERRDEERSAAAEARHNEWLSRFEGWERIKF